MRLRESLPVRLFWLLLAACAACGAAQTPHRPTVGSIAGLVRDHDSGTVIAQAGIHVRAAGDMTRHDTRSNADGHYAIGQLRPGRYSLEAEFAGQPIDVEDIAVRAGNATIVDLTFTLGRPDAVHVDFGNAQARARSIATSRRRSRRPPAGSRARSTRSARAIGSAARS